MKKNKLINRIVVNAIILLCVIVAVMVVCDRMVNHTAKDRLYDSVEDVPHRKVGLVLGTSPISTWNGRRNYYFDHRIKAAADLYNAGKVDWLVVSGGDYRNTENGYPKMIAIYSISLIKFTVIVILIGGKILKTN